MTLRLAQESDLPAIRRIQDASPEAAQWDPAGYLAYECLLACLDDRVAGFLVTRQTAPGEREILNLAIDPGARRRGLARGLLERALQQRAAWFLEVRQSNLPAIRFYESLGFQAVGRREHYYDNPPEEAIVMKFNS